jgi:hypothetical protein
MKTPRLVGAEQFLDFVEKVAIPWRRVDRITGRKGVTGIDADADTRLVGYQGANRRQLAEPRANEGPLAGGVLQEDSGLAFRQTCEDLIQ